MLGDSSVRKRGAKRRGLLARAQAAVEFALIAPVVVVVMLVGVQFAIIGVAALGLGEVAYQGARWAAVNANSSSSQVQTYMLSVASPIIAANNGQYLTISIPAGSMPCTFGNTVTVPVSFDVRHLVVLPNPFMGLVTFPSTLTNSESAFCE
jgi:Flp pilus assembly protein TadG